MNTKSNHKEGQCCQGFSTSEHILLSKFNCYKSLVRPILEYAAVVWAPHTLSAITSIEKYKDMQQDSFVMTIQDTLV